MIKAPETSTPKIQSPVLRILKRLRLVWGLCAHSLGVRYRRRFHSNQHFPKDWPQPLHQTPAGLLRECATDLCTAFYRIGQRCDKLPFVWTFLMGPCFELGSSDTLRLNRRSLANMQDIESFQKEHPTATLFDVEAFHLGWEAGAKWAESNACKSGQEEKPCDSPDRESIPDSPWGRV